MVDNNQLQNEIKKIIDRKDVKYVIAYKKGTYGFRTTPYFVSQREDVAQVIFSPFCLNNLTTYISNEHGKNKTGIIVKGCDSRSLVQLINEKKISRTNLVIIGVSCNGVIDPEKLKKKISEPLENVDVIAKDETFMFTVNGVKREIPKQEIIFDKCIHCEYPTPLIYDVLVGKKIKPLGRETYRDVKDFEKKALADKCEFWNEQFDKCIRCYACRNICPVCFCEECIAEQLNPQWLRRSVNLSENAVWHSIRAFHLAGRCTSCGECERACPMDIPLMLLNKKVEKEVKELFDYTAGKQVNSKPLLALFKPDDPEEDIKQNNGRNNHF
jgi:ferredoxin